MGVITIEVPQNITESHKVDSEDLGARIIETVRQASRNKKKRGLSALVGLWADRKESAEEIARELRRGSNMGRRRA